MKCVLIALAATGLMVSVAHAESDKPMNSEKTAPGTVGAMKNAPADGVATDPQQVEAQQGDASKHSAGTVGAAPMAPTNSQKPEEGQKPDMSK